MNAQEIVAANVAARGYRDGWTVDEFVARQLAKMQEELGEAIEHTDCNDEPQNRLFILLSNNATMAGERGKAAFDDKGCWTGVMIRGLDALRSELADMLVVLFAAAQALDFDVVQAAIDKSSADVARGVR